MFAVSAQAHQAKEVLLGPHEEELQSPRAAAEGVRERAEELGGKARGKAEEAGRGARGAASRALDTVGDKARCGVGWVGGGAADLSSAAEAPLPHLSVP